MRLSVTLYYSACPVNGDECVYCAVRAAMYERWTPCSPNTKFSTKVQFLPAAALSRQSISHHFTFCTSQNFALLPANLKQKDEWAQFGKFQSSIFLFHLLLGRLKRLSNQDKCKTVLNCGQAAGTAGAVNEK